MLFTTLDRCDRWLLAVLKFLTGATFAAVVLSVILGIFYRYVLKSPLSWVEEFSRLNFIWTTFIGACVATRENRHLKIHIFSDKLGPRAAAAHKMLVSVVSMVFLSSVIIYGPTVYEALSMQNYAGMPLSQKWQAVPVIFGAGVMWIYFLAFFLGNIPVLFNKEQTR